MIDTKILEILKEFKLFQRIMKIGGSYALILPKDWVEYCALVTDEDKDPIYWLKMDIENNRLVFYPPTKKEIHDFLTQEFPFLQKKNDKKKLHFSNDEIVEICREILKTRGLDELLKGKK